MNRTQSTSKSITLGLAAILVAHALGAGAEPFVPTNDQQVLERVRVVALDPAARELRSLRAALAADPCDPERAAAFVRCCLERSRADGDPRHLGHAQAALSPWWDKAKPPVDVLVLRATLKQGQHDFTKALADLDLAVQLAPDHAQAWLTRVTILTVLGRYDEARQACVPLARLAPGLIAVTAAASINGLTGRAERSCELLRAALDGDGLTGVAEKLWALTVLGETYSRLGRAADAEKHFRRALNLGQRDVYLLGAYADFLLDQHREREVVDLLKDEIRADSLLLRLCLAERGIYAASRPIAEERRSGMNAAPLSPHVDALRARFEASRVRGDNVHRREESRFALGILRQPDEALRLAWANWEVQREPADARILLEAALAAKQPAAAAPALDFIQQNRLEDAQIAQLIRRLHSLAAK